MANPCLDAFQDAVENTKHVLFKPFNLKKWFYMGIAYILAGGSGGGGGGGGNSRKSDDNKTDYFDRIKEKLDSSHFLNDGTIMVVFFLILAAIVVLCFLSVYVVSVFNFIFLECIINNKVSISEYWRKYRKLGYSYFKWNLGFIVTLIVLIGLFVIIPIIILVPVIKQSGIIIVIAIALSVLIGIVVVIFFSILALITRDLVLPLMIAKDLSVFSAWKELMPYIKKNPGQFALFILIKFGIGLVVVLYALFALLVVLFVCALFFGLPALLVALLINVLHVSMNPVIIGIAIIWAILAILTLIFIASTLIMPTGVFERSYNMSFLGRLEPLYALLKQSSPGEKETA